MIQKFHTSWIPELWLNPWVGQPPALWYSEMAQIATRMTMAMEDQAAPIQNRRLRSICLIACWRASRSLSTGASGPVSAGVSCMMSGILTPFIRSHQLRGHSPPGSRLDPLFALAWTGPTPASAMADDVAGQASHCKAEAAYDRCTHDDPSPLRQVTVLRPGGCLREAGAGTGRRGGDWSRGCARPRR